MANIQTANSLRVAVVRISGGRNSPIRLVHKTSFWAVVTEAVSAISSGPNTTSDRFIKAKEIVTSPTSDSGSRKLIGRSTPCW